MCVVLILTSAASVTNQFMIRNSNFIINQGRGCGVASFFSNCQTCPSLRVECPATAYDLYGVMCLAKANNVEFHREQDWPQPLPLLLEGVPEGRGSDISISAQPTLLFNRLAIFQNKRAQVLHDQIWVVEHIVVRSAES